MFLSTSTNLIHLRPDGSTLPLRDFLRIATGAGFDQVDMNFYDWSRPNMPFLDDGWMDWITQVRHDADLVSARFVQSHGYTFNFCNARANPDLMRNEQTLVLRSVECCHILGATTCVVHPATDYDGEYSRARSLQANIAYFAQLADYCNDFGMTLAVENMVDDVRNLRRRYCSTTEELNDLIDSLHGLGHTNVGVCWDVEHGRIMGIDQPKAIERIGDRLCAMHISDTHSATDPNLMHVLPYLSDIQWSPIIQQLKAMDYQGEFSFEVHNFTRYMPDALLASAVRFAHEVGEHLLSL